MEIKTRYDIGTRLYRFFNDRVSVVEITAVMVNGKGKVEYEFRNSENIHVGCVSEEDVHKNFFFTDTEFIHHLQKYLYEENKKLDERNMVIENEN